MTFQGGEKHREAAVLQGARQIGLKEAKTR